VEIHAGIGLTEPRIGHVLESVAEPQVRPKIPVRAEVTYELDLASKVSAIELVAG